MKITIYLNRTYKNSCNLVSFNIDARNFSITKNNDEKNVFTINGITYVDEKNIVNSMEILVRGYSSSIEFNKLNIYSTNIEYKKEDSKTFIDVINGIKLIESEVK